MKILNNKQVDEVLKRITACQIMTNEGVDNAETMFKMTQHLASIAVTVGGADGAMKVINTVNKHCGRICDDNDENKEDN